MMLWILGGAILLAFLYSGFLAYRVIKEVKPTLKAAKKTASIAHIAALQSQEITDHLNSISENLNREIPHLQFTIALAKDSIEQIKEAASLVKPIQYTYESVKSIYQNNGKPKDWLVALRSRLVS